MSAIWILAVALAAAGDPAAVPGGEPAAAARSGAELRQAVRETMGRLARPSDEELEPAVQELLALYEELQTDDRLPQSQRRELLAKVRVRLLKLAEQIDRRLAAQRRRAGPQRSEAVGAAGIDVLAQAGVLDQPEGLAALLPGGQAVIVPGRQPAAALPGVANPALAGAAPGAGGIAAGRFTGTGGPVDRGQALVELIRRTIAPETWDVNGGLGTIYYWRPGRAIVVRQTSEVHHQLGGLVEQIERMGR
jgi:hypothetical protein